MKNGTLYAKKLKRHFNQLKKTHGKPDIPELIDPIQQLTFGILSVDTSDPRADRAARALREHMVDVNEIRVSTDAEVAAIIRPFVSDPLARANALRRALNAIFRKEHAVTLQRIASLGRREAKQYLDELEGIDPYTAASIILWSFGGHAIPVDQRMVESLRREELLDPDATLPEVQAFLERNVSAADAKIFCLLLQKGIGTRAPKTKARATSKRKTRKTKNKRIAPKKSKHKTTGRKAASR